MYSFKYVIGFIKGKTSWRLNNNIIHHVIIVLAIVNAVSLKFT